MPLARSSSILIAAAALASMTGPAAAATPRATTVHCGQQISRDTRLANDLINCRGTALTVVAGGVTLDLGGHLLDGTNTPGSEGVAVDDHSAVKIENGTVRGFRLNGVGLRNAPRSVVQDLTVRQIGAGGEEGEDVSAGILVRDSDGVTVDGNSTINAVTAFQSDGIDVLFSRHVIVKGNEASRNSWNGIVLFQSDGSQVLGNRTVANTNTGISVFDSPSVLVAQNTSRDHTGDDTAGILLLGTTRDSVVGNRLSGNTLGIDVEGGTSASSVTGNEVSGGTDGIGVMDSDGNTVADNTIHDLPGSGVFLDQFFLEQGASHNTVRGNTVARTGADGFFVGDLSTANRFDRNVATRSRANGFLVTTAGNRLSSNTASFNRLRGIDAVTGTVDAGGNRAFGNGLFPQCTGVACG
jgi:parallel beta-helix repeat protein